MTIAIISDIHGNLEALEKVIQYISENDIDELICLGDIVGYGPNPNECVDLVRKNAKHSIMGNHDYAAIGLADISYFNDYAKISTYWTREKMTEENFNYIKDLPFEVNNEKYTAVHASPVNPSLWQYILSESEAKKQFKAFDQNLCFIGHSHVPITFWNNHYTRDDYIKLEQDYQYIVNVGSVGQPRDGDPRSCFVIYDMQENSVRYVRLDYEIQKTYNKITTAGLPIFLAERLLKGY